MSSGPPSGAPGRGGGHSWQIAAPTGAPATSLQMASGGQPPPPSQQQNQQQQTVQPAQPGQQQTMPPMAYHPQQGGRGSGGRVSHSQQQGGRGSNGPHAYVVGMPPPMGYAAYNPYTQHPQYNPQVSGGRGGGAHGWNPAYPGAPVPVGGNPYAQSGNPYTNNYPPQGGPGRGGNNTGRGGSHRGGVQRGGRGGAGRGTSSSYTPPAPRVKKVSVITDKDGNPIDFSSSSKKSSLAAVVSSSTTVAVDNSSSSNAGAKLRQAALDAIKGKADKASVKRKAEEEEATAAVAIAAEKTVKEEATAATTKKKEEEGAAAKKKAEEEANAADAKEKAEEEAVAAKKKVEEEAAAAKKKAESLIAGVKPKSSLASLLSKQGDKQEESSKATNEEDTATESASSDTQTANGKRRRRVYSKTELERLQSLPVCQSRPTDLPEFVIAKGASAARGGPGGGGGGVDRGDRGDRRQRGGDRSWERGAAPPQQRRGSQQNNPNRNDGGGGQWARGKAPPPPPQQNHGGRGDRGGRGGHGGRGGGPPPYFDGPVVPLSKSENGWRPKTNTGPFVVAEKKVKSILNKMTKEKFDRLSQQIIDIPVKSYKILTMMISYVYEKAIFEPYLGDMYGDLCVRLSQHVQSNSFVQIIESDEEPPTEDGESVPASTDGAAASNFSVYRWSNDVSTDDSDIVGPFTTIEGCMTMALSSDEQQDPVSRGDVELELIKLQIKNGVFIKVLKRKKKQKPDDEEKEEGEEEDDDEIKDEYYTVFFPVSEHEECGQQLSKIFLSERESVSDANKQNSFKRSLLNKCEDEFLKQDIYVDWKKENSTYAESKGSLSAKEQAEKEKDLNYRRGLIKKQMLGNVKFIGQLYKKNLLKEKIMRFCIASLLNLETKNVRSKLPAYHDAGDSEMDEEDHEAICNMFATIGQTIDKAAGASFMKVCFDKIQKLSKTSSLPARSRFMYKDLLDLRSNNWIPRRKEEKAKTIEEIRKDFEREERQKAQESAQGGGNYRGNNRNDYGGRGGGGGRGDYRSNNRNNYTNNSSRPRQQKQIVETDDDGFTTIVGAKQMGGGSSLAQAAQKPQRILQSKPNKTSVGAENTASKRSYPPLDKDQFERRIKTIRNEYMQDPSNLKELMLSMDELIGTENYGSQFVSLNADLMIDCKEDERKAIYLLLETLVKEGRISSNDVKAGLVDIIEFIDSFVCDAPMAFDYLGRMLATMIRSNAVDVSWIGQQAEKTKLSSDANPEKIIRATIKAINTDKGIDAVKNSFGPHQMAMEALLGEDKWTIIKAEISS